MTVALKKYSYIQSKKLCSLDQNEGRVQRWASKRGPKLAGGTHLFEMKAEFEDRCRPTH